MNKGKSLCSCMVDVQLTLTFVLHRSNSFPTFYFIIAAIKLETLQEAMVDLDGSNSLLLT